MSFLPKAILGIVIIVALAGAAFYFWLVAAYTPPKGPDNPAQEGMVKQGAAGKVSFGIGWRDGEHGKVYSVAVGPATDDMSGEDILHVTGTPVPTDLKATEAGKVEIIFDGALADGSHSLVIPVDKNYRASKIIEMENGAVKK